MIGGESLGTLWKGYHVLTLAGLGLGFLRMLANAVWMPRLRFGEAGVRPVSGVAAGRVSVLVPARNEARCIERCVRSLLAQDYPEVEVIVLDDHSEDDTAERVRALGLNESNGGLISGQPLPPGWVGKNWACHQLAEAATGEFLFFTDADTEHSGGMVRALVEASGRYGADLVSAWPRQEVVGWAERAVVSLLPFLGLACYPHTLLRVLGWWKPGRRWIPRGMRRGLGVANGQAMFFRREGYWAVGGHAALAGHLVEDIALGRAMAERMGEGRWWVNVEASGGLRCRMYQSFGEVWEGFTKNVRAAFEDGRLAFVGFGAGLFGMYLLPFLVVAGLGQGRLWALCEVGLILAMRMVAVGVMGGAWSSVVLHPVGVGLALAIGINSWRRSNGRGVVWKGRLYAVEPAGSAGPKGARGVEKAL